MKFVADINPHELKYLIYYDQWQINYEGFNDYTFMIGHMNWLIPQIKRRIELLKKNRCKKE